MPRPSKTDTLCRTVRLKYRFTQKDMAAVLGVSESMINRHECGNVEVGRLLTEKICVLAIPESRREYVRQYDTELTTTLRRALVLLEARTILPSPTTDDKTDDKNP